jgi:hypothetical protein
MNTQENTVLLKQEETELSNINPIYWAKYRDEITGYTNTKYGKIAINRYGEYIIEAWELYSKILKDSLYSTNYNLLKKLCRGIPILEFYTDENYIYPPYYLTTAENRMTNVDYNEITKPIIDKINIHELINVFEGETIYREKTNINSHKITYSCVIISKDKKNQFVFWNLSDGGGWEWVSLAPPPVD